MDLLATHGHCWPSPSHLLMGLSILLYVIPDGYDLGVGILLRGATDDEKDVK